MEMKGFLGQKVSLAKNAESALYGRLFEIFKDIGRDLSPSKEYKELQEIFR